MGDRRERVTPRSPTRSRVWGEGMLDESIFWRSEKRCHVLARSERIVATSERMTMSTTTTMPVGVSW